MAAETSTADELPPQFELIRGLGLDPHEELEVHAHTIEFEAPVQGREQLTIYVYGADVERPDAPLLLFSHGGSVRPSAARNLASFGTTLTIM